MKSLLTILIIISYTCKAQSNSARIGAIEKWKFTVDKNMKILVDTMKLLVAENKKLKDSLIEYRGEFTVEPPLYLVPVAKGKWRIVYSVTPLPTSPVIAIKPTQ